MNTRNTVMPISDQITIPVLPVLSVSDMESPVVLVTTYESLAGANCV
jgi:hypothetical protein